MSVHKNIRMDDDLDEWIRGMMKEYGVKYSKVVKEIIRIKMNADKKASAEREAQD